jgi:hypothetical protein
LPAGEDNPAASAIRNLLQDHYLHSDVTVKNPETRRLHRQEGEKPGPTVLITTWTGRLGHQLDTRLFSLEAQDDPGHIRDALSTQALLEVAEAIEPDPALIAFQSYLQALAPWRVIVPFDRFSCPRNWQASHGPPDSSGLGPASVSFQGSNYSPRWVLPFMCGRKL